VAMISRPQRDPAGARRESADPPLSIGSSGFPHARPHPAPEPDSEAWDELLGLTLAEFASRWERGENPSAEEYLGRLSPDHAADAVELIYREYCLAESAGLNPDPSDYLKRFPAQGDSLRRLFSLHGAFGPLGLRDRADSASLPEVGDEIGPYLLIRELGRGGFARVFLAEQADLDGRLVVVKVSARITPEPRLLARVRHSHIVEVLRHGIAEDGMFQLICMPFLGGATLSTVLTAQRATRRRPARGSDLLAVLDEVSAPEYPRPDIVRPAREVIARLSYPRAIAWIVARLAEALDHAERRGVAHGDLKPSNVLLTADGHPMLLDFNLAHDGLDPGILDAPVDGGGTLAYMAPERLRAIADLIGTPRARAFDRHRADIYALGLLLREALTGQPPEIPERRTRSMQEYADLIAASRNREGAARIQSGRDPIPAALRSILSLCLAPAPSDRYQRASELADDLDRWRSDRPLAFAREPLWPSCLLRQIRSRRPALTVASLCLAIGIAAALTVSYASRTSPRQQAEFKLASLWDRAESGVFPAQRGIQWRTEARGDPAENAIRHLNQYGVLDTDDWRRRDDVRALPERDRAELEIWLLEQVLRYGHALGKRPDSPEDWWRGLVLLERTARMTPLVPLIHQCRLLRGRLKLTRPTSLVDGPAPPNPPPRWMEEYLLGVEAELAGSAAAAQAHYKKVLIDRPTSFWGHYRAAVVACEFHKTRSALSHLTFCVDRRPRNPVLRDRLAGRLFELGRLDAALEQCNKALMLDPDLAESYRTRTLIRGRLGRTEDLISDIRRFELLTRSQGKVPSLKLRLESMISLRNDLVFNKEGRCDDLPRRILDVDFEDVDARMIVAEQLLDAGRRDWDLLGPGNREKNIALMEAALGAIDKILELDPEHLRARYERAMLLRQVESALGEIEKVLKSHPETPRARHEHAILIRLLRREEAARDLEFVMDHPRLEKFLQESHDAISVFHHTTSRYIHEGKILAALRAAERGLAHSERLNWMCGMSHYMMAKIYAVASADAPGLLQKTAFHLKKSGEIRPHFIMKHFEDDPTFDSLRHKIRPLID